MFSDKFGELSWPISQKDTQGISFLLLRGIVVFVTNYDIESVAYYLSIYSSYTILLDCDL